MEFDGCYSARDNTAALLNGETKPGVQCDARIDGVPTYWPRGCRCGAWDACIPDRKQARMDYREHLQKHCGLREV